MARQILVDGMSVLIYLYLVQCAQRRGRSGGKGQSWSCGLVDLKCLPKNQTEEVRQCGASALRIPAGDKTFSLYSTW